VVEKWDMSNSKTLRQFPRDAVGHDFEFLKRGFLEQIDARLRRFKFVEDGRRSGVNVPTIELMLRDIAKRAGARKDVHYGVASRLEMNFPPSQLKKLFKLLSEIQESIPWSGLSILNVYEDARMAKSKEAAEVKQPACSTKSAEAANANSNS
jgi:hypothetical protein